MENWMDVLGLEDYYQISNLGNVKSKKRIGITNYGKRFYGGNLVKPFISTVGYPAVNLTYKGYRKQFHIHVLVLEAFVGKKPKGMECCHNNGIKTDCKLENLRWDTRKNNHKDQKIHGTKAKVGIKINQQLANEIKKLDEKVCQISKKYNLSVTQIWRIKNKKAWNVSE
jgi:uncharacterized protein YeaC (DUF1315 family)